MNSFASMKFNNTETLAFQNWSNLNFDNFARIRQILAMFVVHFQSWIRYSNISPIFWYFYIVDTYGQLFSECTLQPSQFLLFEIQFWLDSDICANLQGVCISRQHFRMTMRLLDMNNIVSEKLVFCSAVLGLLFFKFTSIQSLFSIFKIKMLHNIKTVLTIKQN